MKRTEPNPLISDWWTSFLIYLSTSIDTSNLCHATMNAANTNWNISIGRFQFTVDVFQCRSLKPHRWTPSETLWRVGYFYCSTSERSKTPWDSFLNNWNLPRFFFCFCFCFFFLYELQDGSTGLIPPMDRPWIIGNWRIPNKHFPVIIGVSSGILILLLTITILIAWRCCRYQKLREKNFGQLTFI